MEHIAAAGYFLTALFFLVLCFLLAINWQRQLQGGFLLLACVFSVAWSGLLGYELAFGGLPFHLLWITETLRSMGWMMFLAFLLWELFTRNNVSRTWLISLVSVMALILLVQLVPYEYWLVEYQEYGSRISDLRVVLYLVIAVIGISLVEQFFRNTAIESRWTIKYLCLGLGLGFFYDFFLYADALLFKRIDPVIWDSRGAVNALVAPLVAVSARRNPDWSLKVFVSKQVVFHTTGILGTGVYLLSMAFLGFYIKDFGGEYGDFFRLIFFVIAIVLLFILVSSGQLRARLKVFLNKNFFKYQYDYREEWLNLINQLSTIDSSKPLTERVMKVISGIMDSHQGNLWVCPDNKPCRCVAGLDRMMLDINPEKWRSTIAFMQASQWIIDVDEYRQNKSIYDDLELPQALLERNDIWLLVPLIHEESVHSFVVLSHSNSIDQLNWENRDLLLMAGRQAASYLVLEEAADALAEARQFEGFNRLSAFVIHDLKNLIAQLSLVTSNAARHKHNPAFIDDAMATIENSVGKMNRLMLQLKSAGQSEKAKSIDIKKVLNDVITEKQRQNPKPELIDRLHGNVRLSAEAERLSAIIGHVIQNAQDATPDDGQITVEVEKTDRGLEISVADNGSGMDQSFIKDRLFKPFDTTKGLTGMGIGAYESREFILGMGGDIEVESEPGRGTLFTIIIPVDDEENSRRTD